MIEKIKLENWSIMTNSERAKYCHEVASTYPRYHPERLRIESQADYYDNQHERGNA
jgi:hypothetical protein